MFSISKKILTFVILFCIPALLFPQEAKVLNKILKSGELKVGTSGSQPPFSMKSKDGQLMGFEIDLAEMLTDAMKLKLRYLRYRADLLKK